MNTDDLSVVLARHGVTLIEYFAMICPRYQMYMDLPSMARQTVSEVGLETSKRSVFTSEQYLVALQGMIDKGWLEVAPDPTAEKARLRREGLPHPPEIVPPKGTVAFTRDGFRLSRRIGEERRQESGPRLVAAEFDSRVAVRLRQWVLLTTGKEHCDYWILRAQNQIERPWRRPAKIQRITGPEPIERWRRSRFEVVQGGYRATVHYETMRRRPFRIPDLAMKGYIENFEPVEIVGCCNDWQFYFSDNARELCGTCAVQVQFTWSFNVFGSQTEYGIEEPCETNRRVPLTVAEARRIVKECLYGHRAHRDQS